MGLTRGVGGVYVRRVTVEELKALARAVEPLSGATVELHAHRHFNVYNHLVSRFRERVTLALNRLTQGQDVEPELTEELWLMAKALPGVRTRAEEAANWMRSDPDE